MSDLVVHFQMSPTTSHPQTTTATAVVSDKSSLAAQRTLQAGQGVQSQPMRRVQLLVGHLQKSLQTTSTTVEPAATGYRQPPAARMAEIEREAAEAAARDKDKPSEPTPIVPLVQPPLAREPSDLNF